jgi:hypothetical protein
MLELEGQLAEYFHFIGQQLHDTIEFDKSLFGTIYNSLFLNKKSCDERTLAMSQVSQLIARNYYFRLRNTTVDTLGSTLEYCAHFQHELKSLLEKWAPDVPQHSQFFYNYYQPWLKQLDLCLDWYSFVKNRQLSSHQQLIQLHGLAQRTIFLHYQNYLLQQPFWRSWWLWLFPSKQIKLFESRINLLKELPQTTFIPSHILLMLHVEIMLHAIQFYKNSVSPLDAEYLHDINLIEKVAKNHQNTLHEHADSIPEIVYMNFKESISLRFQHQKDTDWRILYASLAECAQVAHTQMLIQSQESSGLFSSRKSSASSDISSTGSRRRSSNLSLKISSLLGLVKAPN